MSCRLLASSMCTEDCSHHAGIFYRRTLHHAVVAYLFVMSHPRLPGAARIALAQLWDVADLLFAPLRQASTLLGLFLMAFIQ